MILINASLSTLKPTPVVTGGEALRLKLFLLDRKLQLPRIFHRLARTPDEATEEWVSERLLVDALEEAIRVIRRPSLPVDFGSTIRLADMGIYGMAILSAPTVSDALERSVRFQRLMTTSARIYLEQTKGNVRWIWSSAEQRTLGIRIRNEVVLVEHVAVFRALVPGAIPRRITFIHNPPSDCKGHVCFFDCPIEWGMDENSVEWSTAALHLPLNIDPALSKFIECEAQRRLELLSPIGSLNQVKDVILRRLSTGDTSISTVAAVLGRSPRSLRRELADCGHPYRTLVDSVRRQRAMEMASEGKHSMTNIALKLGYSELSAFSRAWRRWFNQSLHETNN